MNLDERYSGRLNRIRSQHEFDDKNKQHQEIEKVALKFRQYLYDYAVSIFKKSPKLLRQLTPKYVNQKGDGLSLFSKTSPPRIKNAKGVILDFLLNRAHVLVDKEEQGNLKLLIEFVDSFKIEQT
jgi:hypothetical protein